MITDSCNCCGRSGHGFKGISRPSHPSWCSICDRNKVRRRCQSEGLYQESDPLKELNWCCDRGCDSFNRSSRCSQIKKTDLELNEKKNSSTEDIVMEGGDNYRGHDGKHHSKYCTEKLDLEVGLRHYNQTSGLNSNQISKSQNYNESTSGRYRPHIPHHENLKTSPNPQRHHTSGDYYNNFSPNSRLPILPERSKTSSEMRERYIKEMEILRSKLSLLKDGIAYDGKRMRQRSESEQGFSELPGGVPKRARDNSPKMMGCSKLSDNVSNNLSLHRFPAKPNSPFQKESKSLSPSFKISSKDEKFPRGVFAESSIKEFSAIESDEDNEDSTCKEDLVNGDNVYASNSDDDDLSVLSMLTNASSDSNTPSKIGETLGSITLNEFPMKESDVGQYQGSNSELVPVHDQTSQNTVVSEKDFFRSSLFPNVPPYVKFFMHDFKGPALPSEIRRHLKWKLSSITPIVIRRTIINSGFRLVRRNYERYYNLIYIPPHRKEGINPPYPGSSRYCRKIPKESNDWTGQWGKQMKSFVFKTLKDFQKLNHFPGTFQIGRKDKLWKNLYRLMVKFGKREFGFIPKTYILPHDRKSLRTAWEKASGPGKGQWIVKPPAAARGTGIKVVHKWGQIPIKESLIVQKYIAQPYLINGSKFDLRLYVLMTSIHPLRIYLYDDGLVRFASVKYSDDLECLSNIFMHLTNYSINKLSKQYQVNADATSCVGHKWSLKSLWTYLAKQGVNVKVLKKNLTDLVIKTIISGESNINILSKNNLPSRYCSYELFGIDVLLDRSLKPWLLEVNISPSLHSASPLDLAVKGPLVQELLNIAGFQIPAKLTKEQEDGFLEGYGIKEKTHTLCYDKRLYWTTLSKEEKAKQESYQNLTRKEYLNTILDDLTPDDVRHLIQFEDELTQLRRFEKIFPTSRTHVYHKFFESPRYYNMMLDAWETKYQRNRSEGIQRLESLCENRIHLNVPFPGGKAKTSQPAHLVDVLCIVQFYRFTNKVFANPKGREYPFRKFEPKSCASPNQTDDKVTVDGEVTTDSEDEKEETEEKGGGVSEEIPASSVPSSSSSSSPLRSSPLKTKSKSSPRPSVVSKPSALSNHTTPNRKSPKTVPRSPSKVENVADSSSQDNGCGGHVPINESRYVMLADVKQSGLKFGPDSKLKQFPNCKLENSIIGEGLSGGKNVLSPTKHIHNACLKMNTSS